ncbi:MAG: M20 family metallopeptidase [Acidimicrobiia bacterium]
MTDTIDATTAKDEAIALVDAVADLLVDASHRIHERPELGYEEHFAADLLASPLESHGVAVERAAYGLATSFAGRAGSGGPHVVVCCEYDALPTVGHGCGHNVIAAAGLGAGLALATLAERCGGRVTVLGTPAEELSGGGKIRLIEAGAFEDADVAMMVHPEPGDVERVPYLANDVLVVEYHGVSAHASSSPWQGRNALDGLVAGYTALQALRGHLPPDHKVFGIITHGGDADNTVPAYAAGRFRVRAPSQAQLDRLKERALACFEGGAAQSGTRLEHRWTGGYADLVANRPLAAAYRRNGEALGRRFVDPHLVPAFVAGSTDMGNVSKVVPTIHPVVKACELGTPGHSHEMREAAASPMADAAVVDGAKALAMTAIDYWTDAALREQVRADFEKRVVATR